MRGGYLRKRENGFWPLLQCEAFSRGSGFQRTRGGARRGGARRGEMARNHGAFRHVSSDILAGGDAAQRKRRAIVAITRGYLFVMRGMCVT